MYNSLSTAQVIKELMRVECFGRGDEAWDCCEALAEYLEWYEEETEQPIELDPIALRCEWSHYTIDEAIKNWSIDTEASGRITEVKLKVLDYLVERTEIIIVSDNLIIVKEF